jgi:hypothetical protein
MQLLLLARVCAVPERPITFLISVPTPAEFNQLINLHTSALTICRDASHLTLTFVCLDVANVELAKLQPE